MASIGGWNEGSLKYSAMAATAAGRAKFANSTLRFLLENKFDGLDLDWEYPAQRGGSRADREHFVRLLSEVNTLLKAHDLLLTIAVAAGNWSVKTSYDVPEIAKHVDLIQVMSYSFTKSQQNVTGFKAPLQGAAYRNVKTAINFWLQSGAPANKLVIGLAFYGRSFILENSTENWPGAPAIGNGTAGPLTHQSGILNYNEICIYLNSNWTRRFNTTYMMPYAFNDTQWVGYDDSESFKHKIHFLKTLNLAGVMIWSIEKDDFRGKCGDAYPLLKAINNYLRENITNSQRYPRLVGTSSTYRSNSFGIWYLILYIIIAIMFLFILCALCCCGAGNLVQLSALSALLISLVNLSN